MALFLFTHGYEFNKKNIKCSNNKNGENTKYKYRHDCNNYCSNNYYNTNCTMDSNNKQRQYTRLASKTKNGMAIDNLYTINLPRLRFNRGNN